VKREFGISGVDQPLVGFQGNFKERLGLVSALNFSPLSAFAQKS